MRVSAREWNDFVDRIFRSRLLSVFSNRVNEWAHPWATRVSWNAVAEGFVARVTPGFCLSEGVVDVSGRGVDGEEVWLSNDADLPINVETWRAIGTDALSVNGGFEQVPDFFKRRGVVDPVDFEVDAGKGVSQVADAFGVDRSNARLLRACDLVLYHDRLETATEWTTGNGSDGSFGQFNVVLKAAPNSRSEGYVRILSKYEPPLPVEPLVKLLGDWSGDAFDSIHIATLYLLSPPGWTRGVPDSELWQGFVHNHVYWNLQYWQKVVEPPPVSANLRLDGRTLGGGALGAVTDQRVALINDEFANLSALLSGAEATGRFFSM